MIQRFCPLVIGMFTLVLLQSAFAGWETGATVRVEDDEGVFCVGQEPAEMVDPSDLPERAFRELLRGFSDQHDRWLLVDSLGIQARIPAEEAYVVLIDGGADSLGEVPPPVSLTAACRVAIELAPRWLRVDVADALARLRDQQDIYANFIIDANDPYVDEVAFQVAHVAPEMLSDSLFLTYPDLLIHNAELIYEIDGHLDYVEIVDHHELPDDYYSTTRYRVVTLDDTSWVEIPREHYYWYVVHPKISDEHVKKSDEPDERQSTYGYFWREYLFHDPSADHSYAEGDYPLLKDYLDSIGIFWDGQQHDLPFGRSLEPDDLALDALGNWATRVVPNAASGNRPVQPNQIAREHNGNCGELQDLLCAAARTALIPALCTMDICEDHVWTEFYWDSQWHPYQVDLGSGSTHIDNPGIAYDCQCGGGKDVSAIWDWRNDGYTWTVTGRYSDSCVLVCTVHDFDGQPVDGARVRLYSEAWSGGGYTTATWGYTSSDGLVRFVLGDHQNFYARVDCPLGSYPVEAGAMVKIIDNSVAGQGYLKPFTVPGAISGCRTTEAPPPPDTVGNYRVEIELDVPHEVIYGMNLYDGNTFAYRIEPGAIDFFICDSANYAAYTMEDSFFAHEIEGDLAHLTLPFILPTDEEWYLVFSSDSRVVNGEEIALTVRLYERQSGFELRDDTSLPVQCHLKQNYPNPFNDATVVSYDIPTKAAGGHTTAQTTLRVYDILGQTVRTLVHGSQAPGLHEVVWNGRDDRGQEVTSGIYLYSLKVGAFETTKRMLLIR